MKIKETFLALIGLSAERFEKLSEAEQTQLTTLSDSLEVAQTGRTDAEAALATANESITELTAANGLAADAIVAHLATIEAHEATISTHVATIAANAATIAAHEATIAELKAELDNTPGAGETVVTTSATEGERVAGSSGDAPKKYWTSADQELAAAKAKLKS